MFWVRAITPSALGTAAGIVGRLLDREFEVASDVFEIEEIVGHVEALVLAAAVAHRGTAIKVVSERLGHAHPAFAMHIYQHLLPGMSGAAAERFATLVATANR